MAPDDHVTSTSPASFPTHPGVSYWQGRAMRAESEARHNRDLAEFTRDMGLAVIRCLKGEGKTDG